MDFEDLGKYLLPVVVMVIILGICLIGGSIVNFQYSMFMIAKT